MKNMDSKDKLSLIIQLDKEGKSRHNIKDILGYSSIDSLTKFMKKQGYIYKNGYILINDDKGMTVVSNDKHMTNVSDQNNIDDNSMTSLINSDLKNNLVGLAADYLDIKKMLEWFKNMNDDKSMIEVSATITDGLKINIDQSEYIRTTVRIGKDSWNKFEQFCNENKEFKKQDLLSQALEEFIEKYN